MTPDLGYVMGLSGIFVAVCLFLSAIYHYLLEPIKARRRLQQRLNSSKRNPLERIQIFKADPNQQTGVLIHIVRTIFGWSKVENLQKRLLQADVFMSPTIFLCIVGMLACLGFIIGMLKDIPALGVLLALFLGFMPFLYLKVKQRRKTKLFETQMPEGMELLARSLRAGHTLASAIELLSREIPAPLGIEMRVAYEEQRLGLAMTEALRRMGDRVDSQDLRYFVTAVLIQSETGGNLAEIMENIGYLIRERLKLRGKIKGLTAEGRFSALILGLLPVVMFLVLSFLNPKYIISLWVEPLGRKLLVAGAVGIVVGFLWMKRMVQIKV